MTLFDQEKAVKEMLAAEREAKRYENRHVWGRPWVGWVSFAVFLLVLDAVLASSLRNYPRHVSPLVLWMPLFSSIFFAAIVALAVWAVLRGDRRPKVGGLQSVAERLRLFRNRNKEGQNRW